MKVLFVTPGSGDGYFCGNCYRDNLMARALHRAGHDVTIVPLYLPLNHVEELRGKAPLFFPATTYYMEQKTGRRTPRWLRKLLTQSRPSAWQLPFLAPRQPKAWKI